MSRRRFNPGLARARDGHLARSAAESADSRLETQEEHTQPGAVDSQALASIINLEDGKGIHSETYTPGVSGWAIDGDGDAEFNNVKVRGEVAATKFLAEPGPNLLANPTFDVDTSNWTADPAGTLGRETAAPYQGAGSGKVTSTVNPQTVGAISEKVPVKPGEAYTAHVVANSSAGSGTLVVTIDWFTTAGALISQTIMSTFGLGPGYLPVLGKGAALAPANAATAAVHLQADTFGVGTIFRFDNVELRSVPMMTGGGWRTSASATPRVQLIQSSIIEFWTGGTNEDEPGQVRGLGTTLSNGDNELRLTSPGRSDTADKAEIWLQAATPSAVANMRLKAQEYYLNTKIAPRGVLSYGENTADVTITGTAVGGTWTDISGCIVAFTAAVGHRYSLHVRAYIAIPSAANIGFVCEVREVSGGASVERLEQDNDWPRATAGADKLWHGSSIVAPSAGVKSWKLSFQAVQASTTFHVPGNVLITKFWVVDEGHE